MVVKFSRYTLPDRRGYFGRFGGMFVPETLMMPLIELAREYQSAKRDSAFQRELRYYLVQYAGRPTPLYYAERLSRRLGIRLFLKREDLTHTGAHKINNAIGQILLARRLGKQRIVAETGAGQHGFAVATVAAKFGLSCVVYMGEKDLYRQALNVFKMRLLGAEVIGVKSGSRTLKEAINDAIRDWVTNVHTTYYLLGSTVGPHPYPLMVRDFQAIIGKETIIQIKKQTDRLPDLVLACVGGGSNALGMFYPFLKTNVRLIGVEAAGMGLNTRKHSATLSCGSVGILHGSLSYLLQNKDGQIQQAHSVSAGLDYPGVGPEHSYLKESGRVEYQAVTDAEALNAFEVLSGEEGIIPALEPAHALACLLKISPNLKRGAVVVLCLSGRGDKDMDIARHFLHFANHNATARSKSNQYQ